jgi:hypothetical protein
MDKFTSSTYYIIAHRANLRGPSELENSPESIIECFNSGFHVEIDVWWKENFFWLGHDFPKYRLEDNSFLTDERSWCHAKNLEAAIKLKEIDSHFFWHQEDDFSLTSKGYFWTYPGKKLSENSIAVMPEWDSHQDTFSLVKGVCTDFPYRYIE